MDSHNITNHRHQGLSVLLTLLLAFMLAFLAGCSTSKTAEESTLVTADPEKHELA